MAASNSMSCSTCLRFHPMERRVPISCVRSKTLITMVFAIPRIPITSASMDVPQAEACASLTN